MTPEERKIYMKRWRENNKDKIAQHREKNKVKQARYYANWYQKNGRKRVDMPDTVAPEKRRYTRYELQRMTDKGRRTKGERVYKQIVTTDYPSQPLSLK